MPEETLSSQLAALADRFELIPRRRVEAAGVRVLGQLAHSARSHLAACRSIVETLLLLEEREYLDAASSRRVRQSLAAIAEHAEQVAGGTELKEPDSAVPAASGGKAALEELVKQSQQELASARDGIVDNIVKTARLIREALKSCGSQEAALVSSFDAAERKARSLQIAPSSNWVETFDQLRSAAVEIERRAEVLELFDFKELLERIRAGGVRLHELQDRELAWLRDTGFAQRLEVREVQAPTAGRQRRSWR